MRLFLFDIDGTLLRGAGPLHGSVLVEAIRHVAGLESTIDGIPVHGMLDRDILSAMMLRGGMEPAAIAAAMPEIVTHAQKLYPERCPDLRSKVLPGVRELLSEIAAAGYPMGLVTGNLTSIGWVKMDCAGLRPFFGFGAFSEMGETRAELARLARDLSGLGSEAVVTHTGDAPSDVLAAQANGFRSVAVATGLTAREALAALHPDLLLTDFSDPWDRARLIQG